MSNTKIPTREEQIAYLKNLPDDMIDTSDTPEITNFSSFTVGKFYRLVKKSVTLRVDADVLEWFQRNNPKYQSAINAALRQFVMQQHYLSKARPRTRHMPSGFSQKPLRYSVSSSDPPRG